jgi:hypothetical protein
LREAADFKSAVSTHFTTRAGPPALSTMVCTPSALRVASLDGCALS